MTADTRRLLMRAMVCVVTMALLASPAMAQRNARPTRDTSAAAPTPAGTASIAGVVRALDSGRPVRRARVMVTSGTGTQNGRAATTGDDGKFEITELAAGRYTVAVSKPGFVNLSFGQKRPRQPALPLQLREGERLTNIDVYLPKGSVIGGHVFDDQGSPLVMASVQVQRYEYRLGERRLIPEGVGRTDDRGEYRVFGLPPGEYYVSAVPPREGFAVARGGGALGGPGGGGPFGGPIRPGIIGPESERPEETTDYAPTYYPGVPSPGDSGRVTLGLGQELTNLDFALQLVPTARITGTVLAPEGRTLRFATVGLTTDGGFAMVGRQQARAGGDGAFTMTGVPPGSYRMVVRGQVEGLDGPLVATVPMNVSGANITGVSLALRPGPDISGSVMFEGGSPDAGDISRMSIAVRGTDSSVGPITMTAANVGAELKFVVRNVTAGPKVVQLQRAPRGWSIKEVRLGADDVSDAPFEVKPDAPLGALTVVLTNAPATLTGVARNGKGEPASDYTAILFPAEPAHWHPLSRRISAKRADQLGQFEFQGLVAGRYLLAAIDVVEEGQWTDPAFLDRIRPRAVEVQLYSGGRVSRDVTGVDTP